MSDLISREALIKLLKDYGHSGDDDYIVEAVNTIPRITNAPVVSGEPVGKVKNGFSYWYKGEPKDETLLYTTPQQPQSVADALKEVISIVWDVMDNPELSGLGYCNDCEGRIRALIKRKAEGVE